MMHAINGLFAILKYVNEGMLSVSIDYYVSHLYV